MEDSLDYFAERYQREHEPSVTQSTISPAVASTASATPALADPEEERAYLELLREIITEGDTEIGRNGATKCLFGRTLRFSLDGGKIPIITTKKTAWKTCLRELLWFIRGDTNVAVLQKQGVHIWDGNSTREYLDSRGLGHYPEGIIGPQYGYQWRYFGANYNPYTASRILRQPRAGEPEGVGDKSAQYTGIDQLAQVIDALRSPEGRKSRRIIMTTWNPAQLDQMALPPCHVMCQFRVTQGNRLSCCLFQRSCDVPVGSPFNIASYSFLTHLLAAHCGLVAHEFVYFMGDCHVYEQHISAVEEQISRAPLGAPTVKIARVRDKIEDYCVEDFVVEGYASHPAIRMPMVV